MSRIITLITVIGAALVVAVPAAWGQTQPDAWSEGMNRKYGLGEYSPEARALRLRSEGLNELYGLGNAYGASAVRIEQARANPVRVKSGSTTAMLDARERAFGAKLDARLSTGTPPDAVERAVGARDREIRDIVVDDRFRIDPTSQPVPVSVTVSDDGIQWPSIGIGFGVGIALALGLLLGLRATRQRQLAH
jgi:hypothetical protein